MIEDPELRRRVERAAEDVVRFMNGRSMRPTAPSTDHTPREAVTWAPPRDPKPGVFTEATLSRSKREILSELRAGVSQAAAAVRCGVSRQYIGQVVAEFHA